MNDHNAVAMFPPCLIPPDRVQLVPMRRSRTRTLGCTEVPRYHISEADPFEVHDCARSLDAIGHNERNVVCKYVGVMVGFTLPRHHLLHPHKLM